MDIKSLLYGAGTLIVGLVIGLFLNSSDMFSGTSTTSSTIVAAGFTTTGTVDTGTLTVDTFSVGATGDSATRINHGFCNIYADTGLAASSTEAVDCGSGSNGATALTGITAGDVCFLSFATTSPATIQGLKIAGVSASSTQGFITFQAVNQTGGAYTWTAAATTSLNYLCIAS